MGALQRALDERSLELRYRGREQWHSVFRTDMPLGPVCKIARPFLRGAARWRLATYISRYIPRCNDAARRCHCESPRRVDKLPDVARPLVVLEQFERVGIDRLRRCLQLFCCLGEIVIQQLRNIAAPLTQRRRVDANDIEAVIQILSKARLLHSARKVLVGRGDDAHIDPDRRLSTDAIKLAFGKHAQ